MGYLTTRLYQTLPDSTRLCLVIPLCSVEKNFNLKMFVYSFHIFKLSFQITRCYQYNTKTFMKQRNLKISYQVDVSVWLVQKLHSIGSFCHSFSSDISAKTNHCLACLSTRLFTNLFFKRIFLWILPKFSPSLFW